MKQWLTFILLLITLAAIFYPCCLTDKCGAEEIAANHHQKKQSGEGACSPFSACASCSGFVQITTSYQIQPPLLTGQVHHIRQVIFNGALYSNTCWQPPRIG